MANFGTDQAEGLRRMLGGQKPRVFTFLSATPEEEKGAMLVNLGASLAQGGSDVVLLDACHAARGISAGVRHSATLLDVARGSCEVVDAVRQMPQGFGIAALAAEGEYASVSHPEVALSLGGAFDALSRQADILVVDAELGDDDAFAIPALGSTDIVIQVSASAASITSAYAIIKRLNGQLGKRPFSVLVTGASDKEAQVVYKNMAQAASRYLSVKLNSLGSVPADEHVTRAARLGRAVIDAFPLAGASVAFRRLAEKFVPSAMPAGEFHGISADGPKLGL